MFYMMKKAIYEQVDADLNTLASVIIDEVEFEHGRIEHEWLEHLTKNPERVNRDYVQIWTIPSDSSQKSPPIPPLKSPVLHGYDLPQFHGKNGAPAFRTVTLANGKKLRAIGMRFYARKSHQGNAFVMVLAHETPALDHFIQRLSWLLPLGVLFMIVASIIITQKLIRDSLLPIKNLEKEITTIDVNSTTNQTLTIENNLPKELLPLAKHYNQLLDRIGQARNKERFFSAHAAHEMRTPLAGIQAILQQALNQPRTPESYVERIEESLEITQRMCDLMNRLLHFSQLQSGTTPFHKKHFNLENLVSQSLKTYEPSIKDKNLSLVYDVDPKDDSSDFSVFSDEELVRVVIKNLLDNAIHYADTDVHKQIKVSLKNTPHSTILQISNPSKDLTQDDIDTFFDAFYRKDKARSTESNRFGLGLALAQEITRSLHIKIKASLKAGHTVILTLEFPK